MKTLTVIKLLVSTVLGIIIDQAFSINDIIRQALKPFMVGPYLQLANPIIVLIFFLLEITAVYEFLNKLKIFEKLIK